MARSKESIVRRTTLARVTAAIVAALTIAGGVGSGPVASATATATTATATAASAGTATAAAAWPSPSGQKAVGATINVSGTLDGKMVRYYGTGDLGSGGQDEGQDPILKLANGAVLKNVILGSPAADGIHCTGTCTLQNVWWEDVGEDAATFKGTSSSQTMTIDGGGARSASDKVFQHNGPGTMNIRNFQVDNFGKLYRSCGNCSTQYKRNVVISNVTATSPGKTLAGINTNYGDTARFSGITIVGDSSKKIVICEKYRGVTSGEPTKIGSGADGVNCVYSSSDITYR
jgi:pectate lyase